MNNSSSLLILSVSLAVFLTLGLLHIWSKLNWANGQMPPVKLFGFTSPILTWIKYKRRPTAHLDWAKLIANNQVTLEICLIVVWALWISRKYLNFDPYLWPAGGEFAMSIQNHFNWRLLGECGGCFFWNGFSNGGAPSFVDIHSAWLHPVVALATLIWGVINGEKIVLIAAFIMAGIAQWYLAKVLHLGLVPRLWSACMAIAGGHLAGRMENGAITLLFSTAACSLVIPFAVDFLWNKRPRAAIGFGVTLGLAFLAGQGYMQIGLLISLLPAIIFFLGKNQENNSSMFRYFIWVAVVAILIDAILWVPFLHFLPNWVKYNAQDFSDAMPLEFAPLTLLMNDMRFFAADIFRGGTYMNINYIGWVPVILAIVAIFCSSKESRQLQIFFIFSIILIYLSSAAMPFRFLVNLWPEAGMMVRYPAAIAGLAIPLVLGLAALGLDYLLGLNWPNLVLTQRDVLNIKSIFEAKTSLLLTIPLIWSLASVAAFSTQWLYLRDINLAYRFILEDMDTSTTEWIQPPWGEYEWFVFARELDYKMAYMFRPWYWEGRKFPTAYIEGSHADVDPASPGFIVSEGGVNIVLHPENEYAFVETAAGPIPCQATAQGGNIDVHCDTAEDGDLIVQENSWIGWSASQDGKSIELLDGDWLKVKAPAGSHDYSFRYRPWDAPLGIGFSFLGVVLSVVLGFRIKVTDERNVDQQTNQHVGDKENY